MQDEILWESVVYPSIWREAIQEGESIEQQGSREK
jgi:hypothetical protein